MIQNNYEKHLKQMSKKSFSVWLYINMKRDFYLDVYTILNRIN